MHTGDTGPHLATVNMTRTAVEAAMGAADHVWQGDGASERSSGPVYLYYLVPDAHGTAALRDKTMNGMRKRYRFVFYSDGTSDSRQLDELRVYDDKGYGGKQINRFAALERSYLLW
jgi:hypothetical protein